METTTTVIPTHSIEHETSRDFDPRATLDFDALTQLRVIQNELYQEAYDYNKSEGVSNNLAQYFASKAVEDGVETYLINQGLAAKDPTFKYYKDGLMELSILNFADKNWKTSREKDAHKRPVQSGRERTIELYEDLTNKFYTDTYEPVAPVTLESIPTPEATPPVDDEYLTPALTPDTPDIATTTEAADPSDPADAEPVETDPFMEAQSRRLDTYRDKLAAHNAKRQGRAFGRGGEAYEQALRDYNNQVIVYGKLTHKELIEDESIDETEKNKKIIEYLFAEQNKLREKSLEELQGTKVHKFITAVAKWMDHEKKSVRMLKSAAVGVGIGLVGGAAVAGAGAVGVVGAAGAAVAGAVGAGAVGLKFARAYAQRDAKAGRGIDLLDEEDKDEIGKPLERPVVLLEKDMEAEEPKAPTGFEELQARFDTLLEVDTENEQSKRKRAIAWAAGTVAVGAFIGNTLASAIADSDVFAGGGQEPNPEANPTPEVDEPTDPNIDTENEPQAPSDGESEPNPPAPEFIPDPAFNVPEGKGGIWMFQNMGLTEADWYSVHQELIANFPNEFYNEGGDVRIAHPGQLSQGVQEFIKARFHMA
jgi:hypothetical protein